MSDDLGDDELGLRSRIMAALRRDGRLFPTTDDEVDRFIRSMEPADVPAGLVERAYRRAMGIASDESDAVDASRAASDIEQQVLALCRNSDGKALPPEVERKLAQARKELPSRTNKPDGESGSQA